MPDAVMVIGNCANLNIQAENFDLNSNFAISPMAKLLNLNSAYYQGWIQLSPSKPDSKGYGNRFAVLLANFKDNIGQFEARVVKMLKKILWPQKDLMFQQTP